MPRPTTPAPEIRIELDDRTPFETWAQELLPWLREVMEYIAEGFAEADIAEIKERLSDYAGFMAYFGTAHAQAQVYYNNALAEGVEQRVAYAPSMAVKAAEADADRQSRMFHVVDRTLNALKHNMIALESRLGFERQALFALGALGRDDIPSTPAARPIRAVR